jgi:hypothetical protein
MKTGSSCNLDTTVSYCPFFLLKKGKTEANFLDVNLIRIAPECTIQAGFPVCIMALLVELCTFRRDK